MTFKHCRVSWRGPRRDLQVLVRLHCGPCSQRAPVDSQVAVASVSSYHGQETIPNQSSRASIIGPPRQAAGSLHRGKLRAVYTHNVYSLNQK